MNPVPQMFSSIPRADPLSLFDKGKPRGVEITEFLHLRTKDVARATQLSTTSVRYDLRMPAQLETWLREIATTVTLVMEFFDSGEKTQLWFLTPNPQLGGVAPIDMIKMGRERKLLSFVQTALAENKR